MICKSCNGNFDAAAFYVSNKARCKTCIKAAAIAHRLENVDYYRSYDRMRASQPHRLEKTKLVVDAWKVQHPKRRAAQVALGNALRDGRVEKFPCMVCGEKSEAHHPDYDRPLDVVWLCPPHHKQAHALAREYREAA
jgi:hypothetical protein